jgi:hypothetical protein
MNDKKTYISGFWYIEGNVKHDIDHYTTFIPLTLEMLKDQYIVFFYQDDFILELVKKTVRTKDIIYIKITVQELPTYEIMNDYVSSIKNQKTEELNTYKEKGVNHYIKHYIPSGHESYRRTITVWTSKLYLIEQVIRENPFHTNTFAWVDAGFSKNKKEINKYQFHENKLNATTSKLRYYGNQIFIMANFMVGSAESWMKVIPLYKQKVVEQKDSNYGHDEETLLFLVYLDHPELFEISSYVEGMTNQIASPTSFVQNNVIDNHFSLSVVLWSLVIMTIIICWRLYRNKKKR